MFMTLKGCCTQKFTKVHRLRLVHNSSDLRNRLSHFSNVKYSTHISILTLNASFQTLLLSVEQIGT